MAARIREHRWTEHELGPIEQWSPELVAALNACLASAVPMQLRWGARGFLFYNDASIPLLGDAHPDALGRPSDAHRDAGMLAQLGYELRTPLTLILDPLERLLADDADPVTAPRDQIEIVHRSAVRIHKLVVALLDLARIDLGRPLAAFEPTNLAELTRHVASTFRSTIEGGGLALDVECEPLPDPVYVDPHLWEKIVLDLLSNAYRFTLEDRIAIALRRDGDAVTLTVRDTGCGIDPQHLPHVFERLYRVEQTQARNQEGPGLGLAVVRELVELHRGRVSIESETGRGTTVTVALQHGWAHLPASQVRHTSSTMYTGAGAGAYIVEAGRWRAADSIAHGPQDPDRPRVLVVDDDPDIREYLVHMLGDEWNVDEARDGNEALAAVKQHAPDLVIADVVMPGMDGLGLLRELRRTAATKHIPVILLTARTGEQARAEGLEAGADDYLTKPFTSNELRARARTQLELSRSRRATTSAAAREKDDFLAMVGHELRTPLATLSTTLQALALRQPSYDIDLMARSVRQLTRLVDDLLDISRLARGKLTIHRKRVELAQAIDRAMELVGPLVTERRTRVFLSIPRSGLRIDADVERLAKVLANVVTNAIQHSEPGTRVAVEAARIDERIRISIKDEGTGIASELLGRVFDAFQAERSAGGLGLGLAIARALTSLHGGTIQLHSEGPGLGTECVIELPIANGAELVQPAPEPARAARKRLLIVEDNDDTSRALKAALEQLGYVVALAHDGPIALNLARAFEPDVVLLDIGLPVMDGWELARRIRERAQDVPFVAVTARDQAADRQRSADAGFSEHLVKPIDIVQLERIVESLPPRTRS